MYILFYLCFCFVFLVFHFALERQKSKCSVAVLFFFLQNAKILKHAKPQKQNDKTQITWGTAALSIFKECRLSHRAMR